MISAFGVPTGVSKLDDQRKSDRRRATGGAIAGVGGVTAGGGLVGGGIPGFKANSSTINDIRQGGVRQRAGAAASSLRGGVFGYRADAHRGFLGRQLKDEAHNARMKRAGGEVVSRQNMFRRGVGTGKVRPEVDIIRHMKAGKKASGVALVGGTAATAYGLHHAKGPKQKQAVAKAKQHPSDTTNSALVAGGSVAAGGSYGGARALEHQGRKWNERATRSYAEAEKIIPNIKGSATDFHPKKTPNPRVGRVRPARTNEEIGNEPQKHLAGKSKLQAEAAGRLRGTASQQSYFGHVYGKTARMARKGPKVGMAVAGIGAGGLLASRARDHDVKKADSSRVSAFGVEH